MTLNLHEENNGDDQRDAVHLMSTASPPFQCSWPLQQDEYPAAYEMQNIQKQLNAIY